MSGLVVRPAVPADRVAWGELFAAYGEFYETAFDAAHLDHVWSLLADPASGLAAHVAEIDGRVIGFAHHRSHPDTFGPGRDWFLDDLYVDPAARGGGAATALIERITELARLDGGGTLRWITAESNDRAQRVYNRLATRTTWVTYEVRL